MSQKIFLLLALVVLVACGGGGPNFEQDIVGSWRTGITEDLPYESVWQFFEDGTLVLTLDPDGLNTAISAEYAFEDNDTITIDQGDGSDIGRRDVSMPDADTLILTAPESGVRNVFTRVEE